MNTLSPKLSIVMPIFNCAELTIKMVDSIIANDYQNWELWAIDDGSSEIDRTIISNHICNDLRIHYIKRDVEPKGAQTCRNIGLCKAIGEYVIFFDSDDILMPFCLKQRISAIELRPDLDFMVFPSTVVKNNNLCPTIFKYSYGYPLYKDDKVAFARRILPFIVWNNIYRTESLRKNHIKWDTRLKSFQDADFNMQTIFKGLKYEYYRGRPDIGYRIDASTSSVSKKATSFEHQASTLYAINKFYEMFQKNYGHKYDADLFHGVLTMLNWIMTDGIVYDYASKMSDIVFSHSKRYGCFFKSQLSISKLLEKLYIKRKFARQLPMFFFLLFHRRLIKRKISEIINYQTR